MFFIFFGTKEKFLGKERRNIHLDGKTELADISVFQSYFHIFWIPIIPLGKKYSVYLLETGEFLINDFFNKMPNELLEQCKDIARRY